MISANSIVGGRYRVIKPLGGGGMKLVYLAEDLRLAARPCALAEMVDGFTNPEMQRQAIAAFQREADMLAQLNNEHIPRIFDRFSEQNHHYLVMEFVDGITMEQALKEAGGKLAEDRVIDIALQILDTLEYLHNLVPPVVYRDLKPSNIMLSKSGPAKLIDFGIARHFQPLSNATMIGTQGYAPPEQYRGKVEARSDLYALGATMHQALSGRDPALEPPFSFPPLRKLRADIKPALANLVDRALAYDVANRIHDAAEFKHRLLEVKSAAAGTIAAATSPASPAAASSPPGKPQLPLPLGPPHPPQAVSPLAPTVLSEAAEIKCPACARRIPADSRFCSYCSADLIHLLGASEIAANPDSETLLLSKQGEHPAWHDAANRIRPHRQRRHGLRTLIMIMMAIFAAAFLLTTVVSYIAGLLGSLSPDTRPRSSAPGIAPPEHPGYPEAAPGGTEPSYRPPGLAALRVALNQHGYTGVQFRMAGDTMELWGTVPSESDRMMVRMMVFTIAGVFSLDDHITVTNGFAGP